MAKAMSANDFFGVETQVADIGLIVVPGAEELANKIDAHLVRWAHELGMKKDTFIIPSICPRFQSGDAKGLIQESLRGDDLYFVVDPGTSQITNQRKARVGMARYAFESAGHAQPRLCLFDGLPENAANVNALCKMPVNRGQNRRLF